MQKDSKGNVFFNNALNTFYLQLCGLGHMVKDYSGSKRRNPLPPLYGLLFLVSSISQTVRAFAHGAKGRQSYFSFQPVLHDWCNKGHGMCYPVCGIMHLKEPLLLIGKSSPCGPWFPLLLSGPFPYV